MPEQINGLPAHVLLVHAVIALIPLAALALIGGVVWPALRRRLGLLIPLLGLVALASVPVTTHAGEWLRDHLPQGLAQTPLVQKHIELGDTLLPWALGIFLASVAVWWLDRRYGLVWRQEPGADADPAAGDDPPAGSGGTAVATRTRTRTALPTWVTAAVAVVAVVVSVGGVYQLYRIGDSGAKAVWTGNFSPTATSHGGG